MVINIYSMRDALTGYAQPTFDLNDSVALRNFSFACTRSDSVLRSNAKDFDLCRIGSFDTESGKIVPADPIEVIANGFQVQLRERQDDIK